MLRLGSDLRRETKHLPYILVLQEGRMGKVRAGVPVQWCAFSLLCKRHKSFANNEMRDLG